MLTAVSVSNHQHSHIINYSDFDTHYDDTYNNYMSGK